MLLLLLALSDSLPFSSPPSPASSTPLVSSMLLNQHILTPRSTHFYCCRALIPNVYKTFRKHSLNTGYIDVFNAKISVEGIPTDHRFAPFDTSPTQHILQPRATTDSGKWFHVIHSSCSSCTDGCSYAIVSIVTAFSSTACGMFCSRYVFPTLRAHRPSRFIQFNLFRDTL